MPLDKLRCTWMKINRFYQVIFAILVIEMGIIPQQRLGFYCNDPALSHPFTGDTITWKWLLGLTFFFPVVVMLLVETVYHRNDNEVDSLQHKRRALNWYKEYLYGVLINLTIIQGLKILIGEPRPHFFDTCKPIEGETCKSSEYVSSYTCGNTRYGFWLSDSYKSFPSGHTSLGLHVGLFTAWYLQKRMSVATSKKSHVSAMQIVCISFSVLCAISRMTDHRHHWWDVLAGVIIGVLILYYTIFYLCENFKYKDGSDISVTNGLVNDNMITNNHISRDKLIL